MSNSLRDRERSGKYGRGGGEAEFDQHVCSGIWKQKGGDSREHAPDHVVVLELLQQADLPDCRAGDAFVFGFETNLLEGDDFAVGDIPCFVDDTIGT